MQDYKKLQVWQNSKKFVKDIYKITSLYPSEEIYGLTNQMRRASTSIPANIAEGCSRSSTKDFSNFLNIALGSANELSTFIEISLDLEFINMDTFNNLQKEIELIKVMLINLISKVRKH